MAIGHRLLAEEPIRLNTDIMNQVLIRPWGSLDSRAESQTELVHKRVVSQLLYKEMELKTMVLRDGRCVFQTERPNALRSHVYAFNKAAPGPRTPLT